MEKADGCSLQSGCVNKPHPFTTERAVSTSLTGAHRAMSILQRLQTVVTDTGHAGGGFRCGSRSCLLEASMSRKLAHARLEFLKQ